jgi:ankyrin repeat protein
LVPMTVPKNFVSMKSHHSNSVARKLLAQYIISEFSPNHFVIPGQNGRSVLHMACMMADISILKLILEHAKQTLHPNIVCEVLMKRCHDSGWNAFHYAISSGSLRVIEAMLQSLS